MPFRIIRNDITKMKVDAIVNTASPHVQYGTGIDKAVYEAAGVEELMAKRKEIGEIPRGASVITEGYNLPAKYIIHTVGIAWNGGKNNEEDILRSCYKTVFQLVVEYNLNSLAIPLLASGNYGFPKGIAIRIALSEIEEFIRNSDVELYLVVFDEKAFSISSELFGDIDAYINDNYVDEKNMDEYPEDFWDKHERYPEYSHSKSTDTVGTSIAAPVLSSKSRSLDDVINGLDKTFMELVFSYADAKGLTDVDVQKRANLDRKAFSKLRCGTTKTPKKSTALALAIALELNLDQTRDLLARAGLALSPCNKQDVVVQYFIERKVYNILEINCALYGRGLGYLGSQLE